MFTVCSKVCSTATSLPHPFNDLIARSERTLTAMGCATSVVHDIAVGNDTQVFRVQAAVLAYSDVYLLAAVVAFAVVPFCFLLSGTKGGGGAVH
jgi:DHA2 family multidrug resistance protein